MLDVATRRRIDTARDILVGKVPDPKSQVEQITIALIYKFMDDMDAESEELGGERKFFAGEFARYGWAKLMHSGLGGHETLNLYAEAITTMPENPGIPPLFRDIFKNAYLPYRDPETLRAFLKIIDDFVYDHSERLGDAFEYLLSVLGSQGDAGQFRTPRHIIDFIVQIVDPKKNETVLDPACGTAGFLISSYKHILKANTDADGQSTITPEERGRLAANFTGYDISPDMVRLSLVNMYLHGFVDPHIYEYDTLTSLDRWSEHADVIVANPPFMSPKGGIRPHNKFGVQSKRSEVLFVDYMAEHLTPNGRAGIIVPEGLVFQGGTAYKQLREMLVEEYLVAVISLPGGVFQPYSGVKTSVLILDKSLAKKSGGVGFFKVENDGFGLGAQRREIDANDLPQARVEIAEYLGRLQTGGSTDNLQFTLGLIVPKARLAKDGDYNLSRERYRENGTRPSRWPMAKLGDVAEYVNGFPFKPEDWHGEGRPIVRIQNLTGTSKAINRTRRSDVPEKYLVRRGDLLISWSATIGFYIWQDDDAYLNQHIFRVDARPQIDKKYLYHLGGRISEEIRKDVHGNTMQHITKGPFEAIGIPLPPLDVQQEIVREIEGYQKVIDGARAVVENYRPHIETDPRWPVAQVTAACEAILTGPFGSSLHQSDYIHGQVPVINPQNLVNGLIKADMKKTVTPETRDRLREFMLREGDVIIARRGEMGRCALVEKAMTGWLCGTGCFILRPNKHCDPRFLLLQMGSARVREFLEQRAVGVTLKNLNQAILASISIPLPPLAEQTAAADRVETEQSLVGASRQLIERFEHKIGTTLARLWAGESE